MNLVRGTFRVRGDSLTSSPRTRTWPSASTSSATRWSASSRSTRSPARCSPSGASLDLPGEALRDLRGPPRAAIESIEDELAEQLAEAPSARARSSRRHGSRSARVRPRDAARGRLLLRHRELLAPPRRPRARARRRGRCSTTSRRLAALHRRVAHRRSRRCAACTRVTRAQAHARRVRLPPAQRARQPAAELRGVRGAHQPGRLRLRHARPVRAERLEPDRGAGDPPDRHRRPEIEVRPTKGQIDDLLAEVQERVEPQRAHAGHDAHEEDGRGPQRLPAGDGREVHVPALRDRHARAHRHPARPAARRVRRVVGINLLREGLDLPEVSLVCILDADKEGYLRSGGSLIQTIGRAARHPLGG
jgi:hypothetical protein